jgi:hypothetical protein
MTGACYQAERDKVFSITDRPAVPTNILGTAATINRCESRKIKLPLPWEKSVKGGISPCPLSPPGRGFAASPSAVSSGSNSSVEWRGEGGS